MIDSAGAQSSKMRPADGNASTSGTATSFGALQQIDAGDLNIGYAEAGPADGSAVVLLHGWPYDIHSFVEVAPLLAAAGYRVVVPYFRGFGTTRFRSDATFRNGEQAALALHVIALLDALQIDRAILAGFDWGARTADIVAALWPERCTGLVSVSGYLIGRPPLSSNGGTSTTSPPNAAGSATTPTGATSPSSSGRPPRPRGPLTMPPSIAARPPSTTPITSRS
jgi:pimeloyl-ACP methyl ester carboxylesterase